jgi:hypothetical protein
MLYSFQLHSEDGGVRILDYRRILEIASYETVVESGESAWIFEVFPRSHDKA